MEKTSITVKVDASTKKEAENIFNDLGLNMTTGINIFLKAVSRERAIPFSLDLKEANDESLKALYEVRNNLDKLKTYNNFKELLTDISKEMDDEFED